MCILTLLKGCGHIGLFQLVVDWWKLSWVSVDRVRLLQYFPGFQGAWTGLKCAYWIPIWVSNKDALWNFSIYLQLIHAHTSVPLQSHWNACNPSWSMPTHPLPFNHTRMHVNQADPCPRTHPFNHTRMHGNHIYNGYLSVFIGWCLHVYIKENHPTVAKTLCDNNLVVIQYVVHKLSLLLFVKQSKPAQVASFIGI